jgi:hypothetical protein
MIWKDSLKYLRTEMASALVRQHALAVPGLRVALGRCVELDRHKTRRAERAWLALLLGIALILMGRKTRIHFPLNHGFFVG